MSYFFLYSNVVVGMEACPLSLHKRGQRKESIFRKTSNHSLPLFFENDTRIELFLFFKSYFSQILQPPWSISRVPSDIGNSLWATIVRWAFNVMKSTHNLSPNQNIFALRIEGEEEIERKRDTSCHDEVVVIDCKAACTWVMCSVALLNKYNVNNARIC